MAIPAPSQAQEVIHLWANGAPGFESRKDLPESAASYWVKDINNPSLTIFLPPRDKANGAAVGYLLARHHGNIHYAGLGIKDILPRIE